MHFCRPAYNRKRFPSACMNRKSGNARFSAFPRPGRGISPLKTLKDCPLEAEMQKNSFCGGTANASPDPRPPPPSEGPVNVVNEKRPSFLWASLRMLLLGHDLPKGLILSLLNFKKIHSRCSRLNVSPCPTRGETCEQILGEF